MHWKIGGWTAASLAIAALLVSGLTFRAWDSAFFSGWPIPLAARTLMQIVVTPWIFLIPLSVALACGAVACFQRSLGRGAGTFLFLYISVVLFIATINLSLNAYLLMKFGSFRYDDVIIPASDFGLVAMSLGILIGAGFFPLILVGIIRKVSGKPTAASNRFEVILRD